MEAAQGSLGAVVRGGRGAGAAPRPRGEEVSGSPEEENSLLDPSCAAPWETLRLRLSGEEGCPQPAHDLLCAEPSLPRCA